jgi:hypothetical protein
MWYVILNVVLAVWVFVDAKKRGAAALGWALWTAALGFLVVPLWLAKRPLREGEVREGGTGWNVCKNLAIFWTLLMVIAGFAGMANVGSTFNPNMNEYETAGTAIGAALGLGFIAFIWLFGVVGALVLGLILKKSSVVERGPTVGGPASPAWAVSGAVVLGILLLGGAVDTSKSAGAPARASRTAVSSYSEPKADKLTLDGDWKWERGEYGTLAIVGTLRNTSNQALSYGQVTFNLYDASGAQVGTATDNISNVEPAGRWRFKAVVIDDNPVKNARLAEVTSY